MAAPPISLRVTAREALQSAQALVRNMNQSRRIPKLDPMMQKISEERQVYIFNVGPWPHFRTLGSAGSWFIPACEKDKEYAAMRPIPGVVTELIPVDEKNFELRQETGGENYDKGGGRYLAEQILGIGKMLPPSYSLVKYGCFIGEGNKPAPTKTELGFAREALLGYFKELVEEARNAYGLGPKEFAETVRKGLHHVAARALNLNDEPWMVKGNPEARIRCEACGTMVEAGTKICPNAKCGWIFDLEWYEKNKAHFAK